MTTKHTFECNLCKGEIRDTGRIGRGIKWTHQGLEWDTVRQTENHLCDDCVNNLMKLLHITAPVISQDIVGASEADP